jgi:HlyD family secretion protein
MKMCSSLVICIAIFFSSCKNDKSQFDASGTFEADETIISSEASGTLKQFDIEEGQVLQSGHLIGYVDSVQLYLKRQQLIAQIRSVLSKKPQIATQTASLKEQLKAAEKEQSRVNNMLKVDAATPRQLDDVTAQVEVLKKQIDAQYSTLDLSSSSLTQETLPIQVQIKQLDDQLNKCRIVNPVNGTVLTKYASVNEVTAAGKALYEIADLSYLTLRAYVTGDQFSKISLNEKLKVMVDDGPGKYKEYEGVVEWISDKAEFTPKTIQTKDERANLVYAVKIKVKNDGKLKIGMYGEVNL